MSSPETKDNPQQLDASVAEKINQQGWMGWLELFSQLGILRQLDLQLARFLASKETSVDPDITAILVAAVSFELSKGNSCLRLSNNWSPLDTFSAKQLEPLIAPHLLEVDWKAHASLSNLIKSSSEQEMRPLVYEFESLYLQKYWQFESQLAQKLVHLSQPVELEPGIKHSLAEELGRLFAWQWGFLFKDLQKLGQAKDMEWQQTICESLDIELTDLVPWDEVLGVAKSATRSEELAPLSKVIPQRACKNYQKVAAATALLRRLCVISGGPGTGKTTTVSKLLAALVSSSEDKLNIKLAAPTGKAAARLTESIGNAIDSLPVAAEVKERIPTSASTIHRLLGARANRVDFKHSASNPLHLDLLILDEASMVDLPLMHKLLDALPSHARLILLGDKDQLSSVEAGAVLGDICSLQTGFTTGHRQALSQLTGFDYSNEPMSRSAVADSLSTLRKSYRFHSRSGIGMLARAINDGNANESNNLLSQGLEDVAYAPLDSDNYAKLVNELAGQYQGYLKVELTAESSMREYAAEVLQRFAKIRLLCAVREGEFGVEGLNHNIEQKLANKGLIARVRETWYIGRPIMVTSNDHGQQLYNGDIGICLMDSAEQRLKVYFEQPDGSVKAILPSRVPPHETAFAMTIHKSQGSEFENTYLILPKMMSPLLTRELFYTGVTRAKSYLKVVADEAIVKRSVLKKTERSSHLADRLNIQS